MKTFTSAILSLATLSTALALEPGRYMITTQCVTEEGTRSLDRGYILVIGTQGDVGLEVAHSGLLDKKNPVVLPRTDSVKIIEGTDGNFILSAQFSVLAPRILRTTRALQIPQQPSPAPEIQPKPYPDKDDYVIHYLNLSFSYSVGGGSDICLSAPSPKFLRAYIGALSKAEQPGAGQPATQPVDKSPAKDQPSTPTSKDAPR